MGKSRENLGLYHFYDAVRLPFGGFCGAGFGSIIKGGAQSERPPDFEIMKLVTMVEQTSAAQMPHMSQSQV